LKELGIEETNFDAMAESACGGGILQVFVPLNKQDIINIYRICL
jgi:hypothetical protein